MFDWVILGGGIHGTYLSNYLLKTTGVDAEKLLVVDPHEKPLLAWRERTAVTGMKFLRSPGEHNLDVGSGALMRFAGKRNSGHIQFYSKYQRPSLNIFNRHCDDVIEKQNLEAVRLNASALSLSAGQNSYIVETSSGDIECKHLILSMGTHDCLSAPAWSKKSELISSPLAHIFSEKFKELQVRDWTEAVVVGGGISAVQLALKLALQNPGHVTLLHQRKIQTFQFDADPCWLNSRCLNLLKGQSDLKKRRRIVENARHLSSIPEDVRRQLNDAIDAGALSAIEASVIDAVGNASSVTLSLSNGTALSSDFIALATGFSRCVPGGEFLAKSVENLNLKCAPCGYPDLDQYLQWSKNLFVTGPLAELVLGPASRNIVGARMASQRILVSDSRLKTVNAKENNYYFLRRRRS